MVYFKWSKKVV